LQQHRNIEVSGATLECTLYGPGTPVVLLANAGCSTGYLDDLARVLAMLEKERPDGLTMFFDAKSTGYRALVGDFAKKHKIPTIFGAKEFAQAGGLMSYAPDVVESFRRSATYVDKILKGAKPGDLPIEQPTKFELVINLKTAKALGLTIPPSVLLRADEVID